MTYHSGKITIDAIAIDPIHHGAGTSGNSAIIRRQLAVHPDTGEHIETAVISGNSIRHMIREGATRFALDAMQMPDGTLSKAVVDVLFSGGHLSKSSASVSLDRARRLAELFPALSLCGYSAGNEMVRSKFRASHLHLVCRDNAWRMPQGAAALPHAKKSAGSFLAERNEFGTRHEAARLPHVARLLLPEVVEARSAAKSGKLARGAVATDKERDSSQMIYDFEVVMPGSRWYGDITWEDLTDGELDALDSAFTYACAGRGPSMGYLYRVGAMANRGMGTMEWHLTGLRRPPSVPRYESDDARLPAVGAGSGDRLQRYREHLRTRREDIVAALEEIAS